jgi:hypothetical protein
MRLLSVEQKGLQGAGDQDTNPAIGKCFQLSRMLTWCPLKDSERTELYLEFGVRMWNYLPKDFRVFLPT